VELYSNLALGSFMLYRGYVGGCEAGSPGPVEPTLEYHVQHGSSPNRNRYPVSEQCQAGSLTGAVASQKVTEACKGSLSAVGNRA
jgi:hypothetical protein